jgi:hypothetical protein
MRDSFIARSVPREVDEPIATAPARPRPRRPVDSWARLAEQLRAIEQWLENLALATDTLPGASRSAPVAARHAYRAIIRRLRRERCSAELLAERARG